jgi:3-dehydroquinate dehydratase
MKTIFAIILGIAVSTPGMIDIQQRLQKAEKQIQTLQTTIVAYHQHEKNRPAENEVEMMVRLRKAIENCGCTFK